MIRTGSRFRLSKFKDEVNSFEDKELRSIFYDLAVEKEDDENYRRNQIEEIFGKNLIAPFQIILLGWNTRAYLGWDISREQFEESSMQLSCGLRRIRSW